MRISDWSSSCALPSSTKAQRKLFFNLRRAKKRLGWLNAEEVRAVARDLNVSEREVREMESRLSGRDIGFDMGNDDNDDAPPAPSAYLIDQGADPSLTYAGADHADTPSDYIGTASLRERESTSVAYPVAGE